MIDYLIEAVGRCGAKLVGYRPKSLSPVARRAALLACLSLSCGGPPETPPSYDLLLITLDTTRADHLGMYGYALETSPKLDALAEDSIVFERALAQAAVTPVSHASILTGLNPYRHGLRVMHGKESNRLKGEIETLAEVWRRAGGETAAVVSAFPVTAEFGLDQGFRVFDAEFLKSNGAGIVRENGVVNTGLSQRRADATTLAAMDQLSRLRDTKLPLFLWVHYFDPHDPLLVVAQSAMSRFPPPTDETGDIMRAIYDAEIYYMDQQIGRLLETYRETRSWDRTIVAVVADHGQGLGDHDWWSHGLLYQEQIRVPLILRGPGLPRGERIAAPVRTIDLMPTVLELAEIDPELWPAMDGSSLLSMIRDGRARRELLGYADSINLLPYRRWDTSARRDLKVDKLYSLTDGRYKLIYHQLHPEESEFYDLEQDPEEKLNLAQSESQEMRTVMQQLLKLDAFSDIVPTGVTLEDIERAKKLESLGYLQ